MSSKSGIFKRIIDHFTGQYPMLSDDDVKDNSSTVAGKVTAKKQSLSSFDLLCVQSDEKDGYLRHDAVKQLGELSDPLALPVLFKRVNDWVPEIRGSALSAIVDLAVEENAQHFVKAIPDLYHLKKCKRVDHSKLIKDLENFLISEENVFNLFEGMDSPNQKISEACYRLVLDNQLGSPDEFILKGLKHNNQSVRIKSAQYLKDLEGEISKEAIAIALKDPCLQVRRDAFIESLKGWGNETLAKEMLFDPHPMIREMACIHLGKSGVDMQYTYLRHLNSDDPKDLCRAIWGIGFLKGKECMDLIKPFTQSEIPSVKHEAIKTLESLSKAPDRFLDTVEWNSVDTLY